MMGSGMVVSQRPGSDTILRHRFDDALAAFLDSQESSWSDSTGSRVVQELRRFVLDGGKRLRPSFCYWGWRGAGADDCGAIVVAAAALELFHAFALIHDDIIDDSDRRRGAPTVHRTFGDLHRRSSWRGEPATFGRNIALLCGDLCAAWSDQMFHGCGLPVDQIRQGRSVLSRMHSEVIAGQYLDLLSQVDGGGSMNRALKVVRMKSARYTVSRPLQVGGALAGAGEELLATYQQIGDPLGDAFQLRDDVLGVFGDPDVTGKSNLEDLREGKPTVLVTLAREQATPEEVVSLDTLIGNPELTQSEADEIRRVMVRTGARERVEELIDERIRHALEALVCAPLAGEAAGALSVLAERLADRQW